MVNVFRKAGISRDTSRFDGHFLGASGVPNTPEEGVPEALGEKGDTVYFVNGIKTDIEANMKDMERIASKGRRVIGIHNATEGFFQDMAQSVGDKLRIGNNPAVNTVKSLLRTGLESGTQMAFVGHSQGAIILSRALKEVRNELREQGKSDAEIEKSFEGVTVETAGGAAYSYPKGPQYTHYVNRFDLVPMLAGKGFSRSPDVVHFSEFEKPYWNSGQDHWRDSAVHASNRSVHGTEIYYGAESPITSEMSA